MTKRKTPGERIAEGEYLMTTFEGGDLQKDLAKRIDRAIRRAEQRKAEAVWDEGYVEGQMGGTPRNPYRKVKR